LIPLTVLQAFKLTAIAFIYADKHIFIVSEQKMSNVSLLYDLKFHLMKLNQDQYQTHLLSFLKIIIYLAHSLLCHSHLEQVLMESLQVFQKSQEVNHLEVL